VGERERERDIDGIAIERNGESKRGRIERQRETVSILLTSQTM